MEIRSVEELWVKFLLIVGSCHVSCLAAEDFLKSDHKHRTHKAAERANELWCYKCSTMDIDKEYCMNVSKNDSSIHHKCDGDMRSCMVKRISYTTTANGSSNKHKLWSLERNCSQKCEAGCIIIGERLKLYKCTSCCEGKNFCNHGNEGERTKIHICSKCCESSFCNIGRGFSSRLVPQPVVALLSCLFLGRKLIRMTKTHRCHPYNHF